MTFAQVGWKQKVSQTSWSDQRSNPLKWLKQLKLLLKRTFHQPNWGTTITPLVSEIHSFLRCLIYSVLLFVRATTSPLPRLCRVCFLLRITDADLPKRCWWGSQRQKIQQVHRKVSMQIITKVSDYMIKSWKKTFPNTKNRTKEGRRGGVHCEVCPSRGEEEIRVGFNMLQQWNKYEYNLPLR